MKVVEDYPPNINDIVKVLDITGFKPVFTYGDTIYNPNGGEISLDLMAHEETHEAQQKKIGVKQWWAMYLEKPDFRLAQELEAFRVQYAFVCDTCNREQRRNQLKAFAKVLSSPMYGNIISKDQAKGAIINGK